MAHAVGARRGGVQTTPSYVGLVAKVCGVADRLGVKLGRWQNPRALESLKGMMRRPNPLVTNIIMMPEAAETKKLDNIIGRSSCS